MAINYETMAVDEFSNFIKTLFGFKTLIKKTTLEIEVTLPEYSEDEEGNFVPTDGTKKKFSIDIKNLQTLLTELSKIDKVGETAIRSGNTYEFLVNAATSRRLMFPRIPKDFSKEDLANHISYKLTIPSDLYLLYILHEIKKTDHKFLRNSVLGGRLYRIASTETDFLTFLKKMFPNFLTAQIGSTKKRSNTDFEELGTAFLFQLSYNLTTSIVQIRYLEEFLKFGRIKRLNRANKSDDIEPPKRKYLADLVLHYQMALSTDSPTLKYLSFYHVMEHFFEEVYNKEIVHSIKDELTKPAFSYNREKDINKLVIFIKKKLKERTDQYDFNEKEALKLTLKKYIDSYENVREELNIYDKSLVAYYKQTPVSFSDGDTVDLNSVDLGDMQVKLANRIYKTRNSIVHSKKSDKLKYIPFDHDKDLLKEIPLMQFLSEKIIIASSSLIED